MTDKIFRSIILVSLITLLLSFVTVLGISQKSFRQKHADDIKIMAKYAAQGINKSGFDYLSELDSKYRLTIIGADGTVLYDNTSSPAEMENHSDRSEFCDAMQNGVGQAYRHSETNSKKTLYYAIRLNDGNVLRVADDGYTLWALIYSMLLPLCVIIILIGGLSVFFAVKMTRNIIKPINDIDLNNPNVDVGYFELSPLTEKIKRQNRFISIRMAELSKKQEEFSLITENMNEGFIVVDRQRDILSYNSSAMKLLGIEIGVGKNAKSSLGTGSKLAFSVDTALSGTHNEQQVKIDNSYYRIIANPVFNNEEVTGAVAVILDVTEKEKMEAIRREFTSNVSHELKTPLTSIRGAAELMAGGMVKSEDIDSFAKMIYEESGHLVSLIEDILRLSQLDEEKIIQEKCPTDLYDIVLSVTNRLKKAAEKRGVTVEFTGEHITVMGVKTILEEMIYNLCDNAVKYNNENGKVYISLLRQGDNCRLSVTDTGIGIAQNELSRVFERFYRVDKSRSKAISGTGLGLSIVKHAAVYHNAEVDITSTENVGTTVTISFKNQSF